MADPYAALWWLPVGGGGHVVVHTSRWWEAMVARRDHRPPQPLFHTALEVFATGSRHLIEMTPAFRQHTDPHAIVATGPVGSPVLGCTRLFRYQVRCWENGVIADRAVAVDAPQRIALTTDSACAVLTHVHTVPTLTWGRDVFGIGDMWNSNSVISWLLCTAGIDASTIAPPAAGRAPGWASGIAAAAHPGHTQSR